MAGIAKFKSHMIRTMLKIDMELKPSKLNK